MKKQFLKGFFEGYNDMLKEMLPELFINFGILAMIGKIGTIFVNHFMKED